MNTSVRNIFSSISVTSLKQLLTWGDQFKVNQAQIDAQHEAIFNISMEIAELWQSRGEIDRLKQLTAKLALVLEVHFRFEEQQLARLGYARLQEHKAEHAVILRELEMIQTRLDKMPPGADRMAPAFSVHNFVLGLTVGHITHSDMDYCELMRNQSRAPLEGAAGAAGPGAIPFRPTERPPLRDPADAIPVAGADAKTQSDVNAPASTL